MIPTSPLPEGYSFVSSGGQGFSVFRRHSDRPIAAGKSLRKVNHLSSKLRVENVLEMSVNHITLYFKLFC